METLFILLLMVLPFAADRIVDPASGIWGKVDVRDMDCARVSQEQAHALHPGEIPDTPARRTSASADALLCARRFMSLGERPARDEQILSSLRQSAGELAETAIALTEGDLTWHVDAFYPEPRVAAKIAVATRASLAEAGRKVSDRVPLLAAGDLSVLGQLPAKDAYPLSCARYFAEGALGEGEAFLGVMIVDSRETQLHAGSCIGGRWRWLR